MKKIGLTGSIGSGKSIVSKVFSILGVKIYYADNEAKKILEYVEIKNALSDRFGCGILSPDNEIDRKKLASIVFSNKDALEYLNSLIHPLVKSDFQNWLELFNNENYVIHEAAIIYESGFYGDFDAIITVSAPEEIRIKRVMERDKISREEVINRMNFQWPDHRKVKLADYVIENDEKQLLIPQIIKIHKKLEFK